MAKAELGTKRTCPETGKKFYDLGKDPVVSPYTGTSYPLSFFEVSAKARPEKAAPPKDAPEDDEDDALETSDDEAADDGNEVSLEEADQEDAAPRRAKTVLSDEDIPDVEDDDDVDDDSETDDDTFLEDDDADDNDMSDIIGGDRGDDDEN